MKQSPIANLKSTIEAAEIVIEDLLSATEENPDWIDSCKICTKSGRRNHNAELCGNHLCNEIGCTALKMFLSKKTIKALKKLTEEPK